MRVTLSLTASRRRRRLARRFRTMVLATSVSLTRLHGAPATARLRERTHFAPTAHHHLGSFWNAPHLWG